MAFFPQSFVGLWAVSMPTRASYYRNLGAFTKLCTGKGYESILFAEKMAASICRRERRLRPNLGLLRFVIPSTKHSPLNSVLLRPSILPSQTRSADTNSCRTWLTYKNAHYQNSWLSSPMEHRENGILFRRPHAECPGKRI